MNAKPKQVFVILNNVEKWKMWNPWGSKDSTIKYTKLKTDNGVGASINWQSYHPEIGLGEFTINESRFDSIIRAEISLNQHKGCFTTFKIKQLNQEVDISWEISGNSNKLPFYLAPFKNISYLFLEKKLGADLDLGLKQLKKVVEAHKAIWLGDCETEMRNFSGLNYIGIRKKVKASDLTALLPFYYQFLQTFALNQQANLTGPPFTINYLAKNGVYDMQMAIQVDKFVLPQDSVNTGILDPANWFVINYYGNYNGIGPYYQMGFDYLAEKNFKATGPPMEFYLVDPIATPDANQWHTQLVFPYKEN